MTQADSRIRELVLAIIFPVIGNSSAWDTDWIAIKIENTPLEIPKSRVTGIKKMPEQLKAIVDGNAITQHATTIKNAWWKPRGELFFNFNYLKFT